MNGIGGEDVFDDGDGYRQPWLGVEMRHLAALAAIARRRSFSGAAEELGYVQSAISQQIARLERVVGARLIARQRGQRTVTLTPAGETLAEHARALLTELQAARLDLAASGYGNDQSVRAGMAPGVAGWLMPRLMPRVATEAPLQRVQFSEHGGPEQLHHLVERGDVDMGFGCPPVDDVTLESRVFLRDEYVAVVPANSVLGRRNTPIAPAELMDYPIMVPPASACFALAELHLESCGLSLTEAVRSPLTPAYGAFVGAGLGVALMPSLAVDRGNSAVQALPLRGVVLPWLVAVFWQRQRCATAVLERFAAIAEASVADLAQSGLAAAAA